jgi:hypothetical protein
MGTESKKEKTEQEIRRHVKVPTYAKINISHKLLISVGARQTNFHCISSYEEGSGITQTEQTGK